MTKATAPDDPWAALLELPRGQEVEITTEDGRVFRGTLLPPHELSGDRVVQLKLANGYNVGIRVGPRARVVAAPPEPSPPAVGTPSAPSTAGPPANGDTWIALLTTGGTIASRVDYRTGGVSPVKDEAEILGFYPDLARSGPVRVRPVFDRLSEEVVPADWVTLAERVAATFAEGARGVVISHGTDTLAFTAAALSFALEELPGPVVLVGAQRSPDRPSSDGNSNLLAAAEVARHAPLGEVVIVMHDGLSDTSFAIHRGTRARKMHSSRRDAFRSRNGPPLGRLVDRALELAPDHRPRSAGPVRVDARLDPRGALLEFYPGLTPDRAEAFVDGLRGVILAGTGLGHVSTVHLPWIRRAVARGAVVGMTTQCLEGSADPYVYATGRELLRAGVTYLGDLLPETAYVKLVFALGRSEDPAEVRRFLREDRAGEFAARHPVEGSG
jgi:glutamyl-tRNA(Gln) amidotransferase subunit D